MQRVASFNSIDIQASSGGGGGSGGAPAPRLHVLSEEEDDEVAPLALAAADALKGTDGCDRLVELRCGRYLYHHAQAAYLPVPALPPDFGAALNALASCRSIKGGWVRCGRRDVT